jgi:translocation and assembly module TamA
MLRYLLAAVLAFASCMPAFAQRPELDIEITGVPRDLLDNVRNSLSLHLQREHPLLNEAVVRRLHRKAPEEIRRALEPFGYYRPRIDSALEFGEERWHARYRIDPGLPLPIAEVRVSIEGEGADDPAFRKWRDGFPLRPGQTLDHAIWEKAKQSLHQLANERGYFAGRMLSHRISVDLDAYTATIELVYSTGRRYAFGPVDIDHEKLDQEFLNRFVTFLPGDPYEGRKLLELRRALADSDYFARADVISLTEQAEDYQVPIYVDLETRPDNRYTAGLGYATDTGARGRLGYERRRANRRGHRYVLDFEQSEIETGFSARYHIPLSRPTTDVLTYSLRWNDEDTDTAERTTTSLGVEVTQQLGSWLRTAGLSFEQERYRVDIENDAVLLIPHVTWQRYRAPQRIAPSHGWILTFGVRGASEQVISDTSFVQPRIEAKYIFSPSDRSRVLLRASGGYSWVPEFSELPASQRFFAGGDQSIRGYAFESLGPRNAEGRVIGGRHLAVGSIEYEYSIGARTALATFFDAGNAFNGDDLRAEQGAGIGLRVRTPIGAIRLDIAQAISLPDRPWRLHLTLGPDL